MHLNGNILAVEQLPVIALDGLCVMEPKLLVTNMSTKEKKKAAAGCSIV